MSKDNDKPIILIGTGGAGKTTIGRLLAKRKSKPFLDVDHLIEEQEKQSIPGIFDTQGEAYFRQLEKDMTIKTILDNPGSVISVGGGAFMNDDIRAYIKEHAVSLFLKADIETLLARVGNGEGRPLLKENPKETLAKLIANRYPVYEKADHIVETKDEDLMETVDRVMEAIQK